MSRKQFQVDKDPWDWGHYIFLFVAAAVILLCWYYKR